MTDKERKLALYCLKASSNYHSEVCEECIKYPNCDHMGQDDVTETIIKALEQEPCEDAIRRADAEALFRNARSKLNPSDYKTADEFNTRDLMLLNAEQFIHMLPSVNSQPTTGHCKDCKYFEYDSVAKVDGIPLIVAHEICNKWGEGCKTGEDGFCFLFEPKAEGRSGYVSFEGEKPQEQGVTTVYPDSPCDLCIYNPPSAGDGKPCTMCPAEGKVEE